MLHRSDYTGGKGDRNKNTRVTFLNLAYKETFVCH